MNHLVVIMLAWMRMEIKWSAENSWIEQRNPASLGKAGQERIGTRDRWGKEGRNNNTTMSVLKTFFNRFAMSYYNYAGWCKIGT